MRHYFAKGVISYKGDWCIVECPKDIVNYYKWWVEKFIGKKISTSYHDAHITVIAGKYDRCAHKPNWGLYDGREIEFVYYSKIFTDAEYITRGEYFWLRVDSPVLREIRTTMGLRPTPYHPFHLTIGYCGY